MGFKMTYQTITIISELNNGVQAWTFQIDEADLSALAEKYGASGCSLLSDAEGIAEEIKDLYK